MKKHTKLYNYILYIKIKQYCRGRGIQGAEGTSPIPASKCHWEKFPLNPRLHGGKILTLELRTNNHHRDCHKPLQIDIPTFIISNT